MKQWFQLILGEYLTRLNQILEVLKPISSNSGFSFIQSLHCMASFSTTSEVVKGSVSDISVIVDSYTNLIQGCI